MNNEKEKYYSNLDTIMRASAFIDKLSDEVFNALFDFYDEIDQDLNSINVDDVIINSLCFMSFEDFEKEEKKEDFNILYKNGTDVVFWN